MYENFEYKGHHVSVETAPMGRGFRWRYVIDGQHFKESNDRPLPNEEIMLREGVDSAKRAIDSF